MLQHDDRLRSNPYNGLFLSGTEDWRCGCRASEVKWLAPREPIVHGRPGLVNQPVRPGRDLPSCPANSFEAVIAGDPLFGFASVLSLTVDNEVRIPRRGGKAGGISSISSRHPGNARQTSLQMLIGGNSMSLTGWCNRARKQAQGDQRGGRIPNARALRTASRLPVASSFM